MLLNKVAHNIFKTSGYVIAYGTTSIAGFYNPYLMFYIPIYAIITQHSYSIFTNTLGKELGSSIRGIFDPTNALTVTIMLPPIKEFFHIFHDGFFKEDILAAEQFFIERGVSIMTTAGSCRDAANWYDKAWHHNSSSNPSEKTSIVYKLDNAGSSIIKYSSIYFCRMVNTKGFSERNNLCAGIGEGAVIITNSLLKNILSPFELITSTYTRIGFEYFVYKISDGVRQNVRSKFNDQDSLKDLINLIPVLGNKISQTFISEWSYGITTNLLRMIYRPVEKKIIDNLQNSSFFTEYINTTDVNAYKHDYGDVKLSNYDDLYKICQIDEKDTCLIDNSTYP